jgi:undecaprenyl-phosphate galactose phosphotransferase
MSTVRPAAAGTAVALTAPLAGEATVPKSSASSLVHKVGCVLVLLASDLVAIALSLQLAILFRAYLLPHLHHNTPQATFSLGHYVRVGWIWLLLLVFFAAEGLYTQRRTFWNEAGRLLKAITMGVPSVLAAVVLGKLSAEVSRPTIVTTGVCLFFLMPASRYWTKRMLCTAGLWRKRILILGATHTARLTLRGLNADPVLGYQVVGLLDNDLGKQGRPVGTSWGQPVSVLGPLAVAQDLIRNNTAKDCLIAMPGIQKNHLLALVHDLQPLCESIYVVPNLWDLPMTNLQLDGLLEQQVLMLKVSNNLAKPWNRWLKRSFDLILGSVLTLLFFPLMALIGLLITLNSKGPILFSQERLGHQGRRFRCFKFRSMQVNGDEQLAFYLQQNPQLADEWTKYAKLRTHDPRLTGVGRFLRRWSLDELPQLFNVLKGEMSLVGPRPYLPRELDRIGADLPIILAARPGMTGFWQVNGKNRLTLEDRIRLEAWYVRNWSLLLDFVILAKTVKVVLVQEDGSGLLEDEQP